MRASTALLITLALITMLAAFLIATKRAGARASGNDQWDETIEEFVRNRVAATYVDRLDPERGRQAFYRAMDAYVDFDPYCDFIPPDELTEWREDTQGHYAGLGIKINEVPEGLEIIGVLPAGPASRAGLLIGQTIVRADGVPLAGKDVMEITRMLKGPADTTVRVGILPGPRPESGAPVGPEHEVVVTRGHVTPPTVFTQRVGPRKDIGLLRLKDFSDESADAFERGVTTLVTTSPPVQALILDLRHNGGGVLEAAIRVADRFLDRGDIVRMEGRVSQTNRRLGANRDENDVLHLPLVVLVDGYSASASEVVAGALQDHRRAVILGSRTYGKFLVQSITEIPSRGVAVKLTTSRYYTPLGRSYQAEKPHAGVRPKPAGLLPDVIVSLDGEQTERLEKHWDDEEAQSWGRTDNLQDPVTSGVDPQLARAIKLLRGELALQRIRKSRTSPRNG